MKEFLDWEQSIKMGKGWYHIITNLYYVFIIELPLSLNSVCSVLSTYLIK